jgi:hypothetical protein
MTTEGGSNLIGKKVGKKSLLKLVEAASQLANQDPFRARQIAAWPNRFYGGTGTVHGNGELNIEVYNNEIVAVWFRCSRLPFTVHEVSTSRAESLSRWEDQLPVITGVELTR